MDAFVYATAALFAAMGVYALAAPAAVLATFGVEVGTPDGRAEVRAVYGGFGLAVAALLAVAAADGGSAREGILVAVGFALAGMAAGRVVARLSERPSGFYPVWLFFWVEVVGAALLLAAAWA
jgi:Domain of unknown function (DUF4345)